MVNIKSITERIICFIIMINPILSLFFDNTGVRYHYISLPLLFICCLIVSLKNKKSFYKIFFISIITVTAIFIAIVNGGKIGKINNHLFNFLAFISLCILFSNDESISNLIKYLKCRKKMMFIILLIINIVEIYMFVTKKGFYYRFSWGGNFFKGTSSMPHTLSYLMLTTIIYSIVMFFICSEKKFLLFSMLPYFFIFESGARISLILAGILGLFEVDIVFSYKEKSKIVKFIKAMIICGMVFLIFKDKILESDLMIKILKRSDSSDASAGRTVLWGDLIGRYIHNPSKWLFGFGDDMVYYYSGINKTIGESIWAHNDFIQTLFGKGIVGIISYLIGLASYIKTIIKRNGNHYSLLIIAFFFLAAYLNGFYSYRDIMISVPMIYIMNDYLYNKRRIGEQNVE